MPDPTTEIKASPLIRIPVEQSDTTLCEIRCAARGLEIWLALFASEPFVPTKSTTDLCVATGTPEQTISNLHSLIDAAKRCVDAVAEKYGIAT